MNDSRIQGRGRFEALARETKVSKLLAVLERAFTQSRVDMTPSAVRQLRASDWEKAARVARVPMPSATTIAVLVERVRAKMAEAS